MGIPFVAIHSVVRGSMEKLWEARQEASWKRSAGDCLWVIICHEHVVQVQEEDYREYGGLICC